MTGPLAEISPFARHEFSHYNKPVTITAPQPGAPRDARANRYDHSAIGHAVAFPVIL